ncbi:uncharacterized protein LOC116203820 isoform X1 [Punica granatum]|uniref:Uncharacterized protein LOC116203820 isoform X1 n=1 Tax=Punica granatum TaxID=22663 RepID=A0A6P8D546_PUNGR|nr:uncharacterized protein LOC116203820 isoform X1 [Punica granatum]XP_031391620.1 uncharacterized protein LOC116203820 isoform X1 [Punica granatum]XP_031391621.1 uncharacterized protein LOC116203820 isoform X1 [Punica granatum]
MNSSFSPPPSRIWDCRLHLDSVPHGPRIGTDLLLHSDRKGLRGRIGSDKFTSHHHSVSDGALSYSGSLSDSVQASRRWTSPVQKFKVNEVAASSITGLRLDTPYPCSIEGCPGARAVAAASPGSGSPSSLSEFGRWESTSRQPHTPLPSRPFSRRMHMSKAVYPLVFHNPVSDCKALGDADVNSLGRFTPGEGQISPTYWPEDRPLKFRRTLVERQKSEIASPDLSWSSRREEAFRWSSSSSYDFGLDGERYDVVENLENPMSPNSGSAVDQKCGVCRKLLVQKSPWSSNRIMRGNDMPIAGILPCGHVFHADCLEHVTPKTQIHEPPCPLCLKVVGAGEESESASVSEPLHLALRSLRSSRRGVVVSEAQQEASEKQSGKWARVGSRWNIGGSSIRKRLKKHLTFKSKVSDALHGKGKH